MTISPSNLGLLGLEARDRITGFAGVITSISFDLYGCVQAVITPNGLDKDGKIQDGRWMDTNRLEVSTTRIMPVPDFTSVDKNKERGAAEKPAFER